ncbi:hypothetical protein [Thauera sp.]|uniref:hypothetical protein n=1 Tax=Thauera sp. TaxID=1905334 RepID=UPI002CCD7AA3|nr:hypothetical protein [Thauera sp.]HRP25368.1 hypothetical protein [Thauera sp.]
MPANIRALQMMMRLSRLLNGLTGGSFDEMFCSRIWRASYGDSRLVRTIDAIMFRIYGERDHCRNCTLYEFLRKAPADEGEE